jgi:alkylhydroperoxidase family enzyme
VYSHAYFLRVQGADEQTVQALATGDVSRANLTLADKALLAYVKKVTEAAYKTTPEDVQALRDAGWSEDQIAEAVYITALFAFFNRVADAFGIEPMGYLEMNKLSE